MPPESPERGEARRARLPQVSVIVPARNEEACLGQCLRSLVTQAGVEHEVIVVDDASTDRTPELARSFAAVTVIPAGELPAGWSGKCNAAWTGAKAARGQWLLFTDADTTHLPGSLARSLREAERDGLALLSYSPEQEIHGFVQWTVMPAIFGELATTYPPQDVSDPKSRVAAANGQYLLISREAYDAVGGHRAVSSSLLEDVELAKLVKASGRLIRLRYGEGLVRARMYRDTPALIEGWSKNLVLLFARAGKLAMTRLAELVAIVVGVVLLAWALTHGSDVGRDVASREVVLAVAGAALLAWLRVLKRVARAHCGITALVLAPLGLPIFSYLLLRSRFYYKWRRSVTWKGRAYCPSIPQP